MIVPWDKLHKSPRTTDFPVRRTALIDRLEVRRTGMGEPPRSDDRLTRIHRKQTVEPS
jgi:hypothetical protein